MRLVFVVAILLPISIVLWLITLILYASKTESVPVSPLRMLIAVIAPVLMAKWGLRRNSLDKTGAIAGLLIGFFLTVSNYCFLASLLMFFVTASKVTKFRKEEKKKFEEDFKEGGQRNWVQVLCNGGIAAEFALLYMMDTGCTETLIAFETHYSASWFSLAVLGTLCCSSGDTFSSEIGSVIGKSKESRLITNFQKVPRGTNGGITVIGTLASMVGGCLVGLAFYLTLLVLYDPEDLMTAPAQWLLVPSGALFGLLGSTVDSFLGATLQYSGYDKKKRCIVEHAGPDVEYICGSETLDNHSVNLLATFITGMLAPRIAFYMWKAVTLS